MPIQQKARYRILAGLLDTSFGRASEKHPQSNHFLKMTMPLENTIECKAQIIVNMGDSTNMYVALRKKFREELLDLIKKRLEKVSEEYAEAVKQSNNKDLLSYRKQPHEKPAEKSVTLKVDNNTIQEWLEQVSMSAYRTNKTCIYHLNCLVTIS